MVGVGILWAKVTDQYIDDQLYPYDQPQKYNQDHLLILEFR